jgi:hypothetical protein
MLIFKVFDVGRNEVSIVPTLFFICTVSVFSEQLSKAYPVYYGSLKAYLGNGAYLN